MFFSSCFCILLGCKYVFWMCITVFVLKLINLFNAYILLFLSIWVFVLLTGNKSRGWKTCCVSNVKQTMHQNFSNSCYSLHLRFAVSALGDDFTGGGKVIFISLYLLICNILCFTVLYLIRCVVVTACKLIFIQRVSKSWQKTKAVTKS